MKRWAGLDLQIENCLRRLRGCVAYHGRLQNIRWLLIDDISRVLCARRITCIGYFQPDWWCRHVHWANMLEISFRASHAAVTDPRYVNKCWRIMKVDREPSWDAMTQSRCWDAHKCVDHRFMFLWINERSENQHRRQRQICRVVSLDVCRVSKERKEFWGNIWFFISLAWRSTTQWSNEPFPVARQVNTDGHLIGDGMRVPKWQQFKLMAHLPLRNVLLSSLHVTRSNCDFADREGERKPFLRRAIQLSCRDANWI